MARRPAAESPQNKAKKGPTFRRTMKLLQARTRELRQMHGLSYKDLEARSDINWRQLVSIEKGEDVNPTMVTITRLADAFGVEPYELLTAAQSGIRTKNDTGASVTSLPVATQTKKSAG